MLDSYRKTLIFYKIHFELRTIHSSNASLPLTRRGFINTTSKQSNNLENNVPKMSRNRKKTKFAKGTESYPSRGLQQVINIRMKYSKFAINVNLRIFETSAAYLYFQKYNISLKCFSASSQSLFRPTICLGNQLWFQRKVQLTN